MFLFESFSWQTGLMWIAVVAGLMLFNHLARWNKWISCLLFIVLPIALTSFVWPKTAGAGSSVGTWFHWVKVYSALAGCLGFMYIRFNEKAAKNKYWLLFPPLILAINILEAVIRDFQVYSLYSTELYGSVVDYVTMKGGPWNVLNGVAGIINIVTLTGWMGIYISKDKYRDMVWADQLWWWIIAYDVWNFAYVYNCVSDHSFYAGAALLISCTIPAFFLGKGAWLQHRAQTLALWMMFTMCFPYFTDFSKYAVKSSHSETALWTVSALALAINVAVLVYQVYRMAKAKRNPLREEIYVDTKAYKTLLAKRPR